MVSKDVSINKETLTSRRHCWLVLAIQSVTRPLAM